ncbi:MULTISPECIES: GIY-YIG nuclease family protein [unclassified Empedobacter]|uniref:GIY-YIG nuclease family protein n=1 Tax=Empedobacter TaxID=59734 RepID=UPI0025C349B9|nr:MULTISPECIES: GIY-YIG nuclease family protein [unclassified Empedobacter]
MKKGGVVYIMANKRNGTLYTGVTADLKRRVYEHKTKYNPESFTAKYNCTILVYYKSFHSIEDAITEEKRIKAGNRKNKLKQIETLNPNWIDLWDEINEW